MKNIAIFYIHNTLGKLKQENYLIKELQSVAEEIYLVCDRAIQNIDILLEKNSVYIVKGDFNNKIDAYCFGYHYFNISKKEYQDLILCDNSFLGPFLPLSDICNTMKSKTVNYWSISKYAQMLDENYQTIFEHNDFSFIYLSHEIIKEARFEEFWNEIIPEDELASEVKLTQKLHLDFIGSTYINYSNLDSDKDLNNIKWLEELPYTMLKDYNSPIIKKNSFTQSSYRYTNINEKLKALEYAERQEGYDIDIIWDYLLSNYDISDIIDMLHLFYVIPNDRVSEPIYQKRKCAIIIHLTYPKILKKAFEYIEKIPEEIDIYITSKGEFCIEQIKKYLQQINRKNYKLLIAGERGRDISALLVTCKNILMQYQYLCFVHDNKTRNNLGPDIIGECQMFARWDNAIKSSEYISQILNLFETHNHMGILIPPVLYAGGIFGTIARTWASSFQATCDLAKKLHLSVDISMDNYNYSLGTTFWCRPKALKKLFEADWSYEDFQEEPLAPDGTLSHAVERILLYAAQDAGYYSAIIENHEYASVHISDFSFMLKQIMNKTMYPISGYFDSYISNMDINKLKNFIYSNDHIYIYGYGKIAHEISDLLSNLHLKFDSYVVSDDQKKLPNDEVIFFSDIPNAKEKTGIIVALTGYYQREVVPFLIEKGYTNLYIV